MSTGDIALGQKISFYRKRAKLSQLELELEIDAAQGSISRIENGQVNPTKETIRKIIDVLALNLIEAAELYELSIEDISKIIRLSGKLSHNLNLRQTLSSASHEITKDLNLSGVCILLIENGFLQVEAIEDLPYGPDLMIRLIGGPVTKLKLPLNNNSKNIILQSARENLVISSFNIYDFTQDVLSRRVAGLMARSTNFQSGIVFPLNYDHETIGAIMFMKAVKEDYSREYEILEAFTENLSIAIMNAKKFELVNMSTSLI